MELHDIISEGVRGRGRRDAGGGDLASSMVSLAWRGLKGATKLAIKGARVLSGVDRKKELELAHSVGFHQGYHAVTPTGKINKISKPPIHYHNPGMEEHLKAFDAGYDHGARTAGWTSSPHTNP